MAFQFFWEDGDDLDFNVSTDGRECVVTIQIGYDDISDNTYSLFVAMSPVAGMESDVFEIVFCIIQYDHEEECSYQLWDGLQTKNHISDPEHRTACLWGLFKAIEILIDQISPRVVSMIAREPALPDKALRKYHLAASVFSKAGFTVGQPDPYHDRQIWLMERVS